MHLLSAELATSDDLDEAIDLGQTPGDILFLSAAETELACLARAFDQMVGDQTGREQIGADQPGRDQLERPAFTLRLANLLQLSHPMSVDLYVDAMVSRAKLVILRILGGKSYWSYGLEQIEAACAEHGIPLIALPGDDKPDAELERASSVADDVRNRVWAYLIQGGIDNAAQCLAYASELIGGNHAWLEPKPLLGAGLYMPGMANPSLADLQRHWDLKGARKSEKAGHRPVAAIIFYRALFQAGQLDVIDALIEALDKVDNGAGLEALPIFVTSLKDPATASIVEGLLRAAKVDVVLNGTGFAIGRRPTVLEASGAPVIQMVMSGGSEEGWRDKLSGLSPRDLAMHVVLPEIDGRVMSRAVSFKGDPVLHEPTQIKLTRYVPVPDRVEFVADLAASWASLRHKSPVERRIAIVLANYPTRDGRLANGVGLDTPASVINIMRALKNEGYAIDGIPEDGDQLIRMLQAGVTNQTSQGRDIRASLDAAQYRAFLSNLPEQARQSLIDQWGEAPSAPIPLAVLAFDQVVVAIQPARGYDADPEKTYHSPDLIPTHDYLAFYGWLRDVFGADAIIHAGKHGNLEWLPGKATALSRSCWPEIAFGPTPHLYPFIVNDPGEGSQAKRRSQAVIIDHLTPPMTRAETYGDLVQLERLVDEYYEAAHLDPRRTAILQAQILEESQRLGLHRDLNLDGALNDNEQLAELDNHLCELKEMQIRDGLHVLGESPVDRQRLDLLMALLRLPRGPDEGRTASLLRALARDLDLAVDPLEIDYARPWTGPRPPILAERGDQPWRTLGDTVERLEALAVHLLQVPDALPAGLANTQKVLEDAKDLAARLDQCGSREIERLIEGLNGRFVEPGPSGAPTRGRPDVLPTGRNFYSIDSRALPTMTAWNLGWTSAARVIDLYTQTHGDWPRKIALSAWGTANMRTGGDDLAQALALMGCRPVWDQTSGRVTGIEIIPLSILGRPRVDVTLRVSGFFRDAFPAQIELIDDAVRKIASLDEPASMNPLAAAASMETDRLIKDGVDEAQARRIASVRIYGSKPGAYGAGLQALMDSGNWHNDDDLADAYLAWGGFAYGRQLEGEAGHAGLRDRLSEIELVLHNQDNREHDILDSDDYYQFEGGITAAIRQASGRNPTVFHNDHSRPESPKIRPLALEIARVVRGRAANPKWIRGVMRHGYKGAFEMAATVDYLFAFAATTRMVEDHHFDQLFDAYVGDDEVRAFFEQSNPAALREMAQKFDEAIRRGLWRPGRNSVGQTLTPWLNGAKV